MDALVWRVVRRERAMDVSEDGLFLALFHVPRLVQVAKEQVAKVQVQGRESGRRRWTQAGPEEDTS